MYEISWNDRSTKIGFRKADAEVSYRGVEDDNKIAFKQTLRHRHLAGENLNHTLSTII